MSTGANLPPQAYFKVAHITAEKFQPVLDAMPRPEVHKRELDIAEAITPTAIRDLAGEVSDFLSQPINVAVLRRFDRREPETGGHKWHRQPERFAGRTALVFLSGQANLFAKVDGRTKRVRTVAGTVVHMDSSLFHSMGRPSAIEPQYSLLFAHDITKTAE